MRRMLVCLGWMFCIVMGYTSLLWAQNPLPLSLSQDQWVGAKQSIELPTGLTMKYVEMGQANGPALILLHGMTDNSRSWSLIAPYSGYNKKTGTKCSAPIPVFVRVSA